jgi:glycerol kinase
MILAVDQGTTGTRACVVDGDGQVLGQSYLAHGQHHPRPGWVEHDPDEIWRNLERVVDDARVLAGSPKLDGIALANQGETVLAWDRRDGRPIHRAIVWQDGRTQAFVDDLARDRALAAEVHRMTGLRLDPYFSAPKLRWILDHVPEARALATEGHLALGTLDAWLHFKLGGSYVTDASTAARTMLYDLESGVWSPSLCQRLGLHPSLLPAIVSSAGALGRTADGVPIVAALVDQPAAMIGHGCLEAGRIKATYGTGCFVYLNTGSERRDSHHGLLTTLAWERDGEKTFAFDGGILAAGSVVTWLRDQLGLIERAADIDALADEARPADVVCVPALAGLGAPHWNRRARAAWLGMDLSTGRAELVHAALEGIACRVAEVVDSMQTESGLAVSSLRVDGGLTGSQALMQLQADLLGVPVEVSGEAEATVMGAAWLGLRAAGVWSSDDEIHDRVRTAQVFEPRRSADERQARRARFAKALKLAEAWP